MSFLRHLKQHPHFFIVVVVWFLSLIIFTPLLVDWQNQLLDWHDYPLVASILWQYAVNFSSGWQAGPFFAQMFYPHTDALLYTDLFLPHGLATIMLSFLTDNPVASFNILFVATLLLNSLAAHFLWRQVFGKFSVLFVATFFTALSPFFFLNLSHFQMISFWPSLFALGLLLRAHTNWWRKVLFLALLIFVQLSISVYLWSYLLAAVVGWVVLNVAESWRRQKKPVLDKSVIGALIVSLALIAPLLWLYSQVQSDHSVATTQEAIVGQSAHLSDYFLVRLPDLLFESTLPMKAWASLNKHDTGGHGAFPGFVLSLLGGWGIYLTAKGFTKKRSNKNKLIPTFFALLMVMGLIFSLGPRCNFNNFYCIVPLPLWGLLKVIPALDILKVVSRWSFYFYLGLIYFAAVGFRDLLSKFSLRQKLAVVTIVVLIYLLESVPVHRPYEPWPYFTPVHQYLTDACSQQEQVVLSYPYDQRGKFFILMSLRNRSTMLLASTKHKCRLVNGYSGIVPKGYFEYERQLNHYFDSAQFPEFIKTLKEKDVSYLQVNNPFLTPDTDKNWRQWVATQSSGIVKVAQDTSTSLYYLAD